MSDRGYRQAIASLLHQSDPKLELTWGFVLSATELYEDSGYGHVDVVTPHERVALVREMIDTTRGRLLMLAGHTTMYLDLPDDVCDVPPLAALPAVDVNFLIDNEHGSTSVHARLPWETLKVFPIAVLTQGPLDGWPR